MTRYLLDTNIISDLVRNPGGRAARRIGEVGDNAVFTSIIVVAELRYGSAKNPAPRIVAAVESLLLELEAVPFDAAAASAYGDLRTALEARGQPIGPNDMLIAAQALAARAVMVTANIREFARVPGLSVENWLE